MQKKTKADVITTLNNRKKEQLGSVKKQNTSELEPNQDHIKKKIYPSTNIQNCNIIKKNLLLITSLSLLYIDFANAYCIGYSEPIEQCIRCFAVIF